MVTLASIAIVGSSVSALSLSISPQATTPNAPPPSPEPQPDGFSFFSPAANSAAFMAYINERVQFSPQFAIVRPEGTHAVFANDGQGRTSDIAFIANGSVTLRKVTFKRAHGQEQADALMITTFSQDRDTTNDLFHIYLNYSGDRERITHYTLDTPYGPALAVPKRNANGLYDLSVAPLGAYENFRIANAQPWDGGAFLIASASGAEAA
ncbi:hypothetical protein THASP1DRAFT_33328 [Thamnocephalis sphaerospora]|uniref:Glycoside hydrolase 131 catalytic N-terminal domain-containing protein n=1 Tax=Thamnocephalis sphaerospora TaxID=78915 RepID=A0A4V1IVQ3_9FUNG|nr:hypothetical protein THASP1DRAFT_33328 [Thamnocephalis sphaerospora]|eukprot:RKP04859.1 hypothetical protein THASP1DRAFT_33328 [Thamnocephalis sphaerospora]